jgi:hypothetical protein
LLSMTLVSGAAVGRGEPADGGGGAGGVRLRVKNRGVRGLVLGPSVGGGGA